MERLVFTEVEFNDSGFQPRGRRSYKVFWSDVIRIAYGYEIHSAAVVDWNFWAFQTKNPDLMLEFEIGSISTMRFSDEIHRRLGNPKIPPMKDWIDSKYNIKTFVVYPEADFGRPLYRIEWHNWWSWRGNFKFAQPFVVEKDKSEISI